MKNVAGVIMGYFSFTFSLSAAFFVTIRLLQFLGSHISTGWIMATIAFFVFLTAFEISYKVAFFVSGPIISKKSAAVIMLVLMIADMIFIQYSFFTSNGFTIWFILSGIFALLQLILWLVFAAIEPDVFVDHLKLVKENAACMSAEEYINQEQVIKSENKIKMVTGLISFSVVTVLSLIIIYIAS